MRIADFGNLYTGAYKIEADFKTLCGTSYVSIMQVKLANGLVNARKTTTCFMLWVIDDNLHYYNSSKIIFKNVCDTFHHISLEYNSNTAMVDIWVDYNHVFTVASECASNLLKYFKLGVYTQGQARNPVSMKSEIVFKNVQLLYNLYPPSSSPTVKSSFQPTLRTVPSLNPTTAAPSLKPSTYPSAATSVIPSMWPKSAMPSTVPSTGPSSFRPSITPSTVPSMKPSTAGPSSAHPSTVPSTVPSIKPTTAGPSSSQPSKSPSFKSSQKPSAKPST